MEKRRSNGQLAVGIIIAALGVLMLFEHVIGFQVRDIWRLWPLILVVLGLVRLSGMGDGERRGSGLNAVIVGLWLLVNTLELFDLDWSNSWPLLLIGLGLGKLVFPDKDGRSSGLLLFLVGIWALVNVLELWGIYWEISWPFAIIIVGLTIVWKALFERSKGGAAKENTDDPS